MKITFIADTHYYSKSLGTCGKAYELRSGSDQKCLAETAEITDAAFADIAKSDTDAVFILGDVSNDGETVSHLEFREKLYKLQKSKPVYLITATHDWCCDENPRRFEGDAVYNDVPVMKSYDLPKFYADFGPKQAISTFITKIGTVCFVIALSEKARVLCLNDDKNENGHAGFDADCRKWITEQIDDAKKCGCTLIGIEHHLLVPHISPLLTGGSTCVENREEVASFFADAGLKYMFVGHSHIQHTDSFTSRAGNKITEVNVGALSGYPAPIVDVSVLENGRLEYNVRHLKSFLVNGHETDAGDYLARHACDLIFRITECRDKKQFAERTEALGINPKKFLPFWPVIKPLLKKIDTALVWDAYKFLKAMHLQGNVTRAQALEYRYKPLREMIAEVWLSALDGSVSIHPKGSAYYNLAMAAVSAPSKTVKGNSDLRQLISAADNILTGGNYNNQHDVI